MGLFSSSSSSSAGTVAVDVEGDFKKFHNQADKEAGAAGDSFGSKFGAGFGKKVATLGATYLGANFVKSAISEASDLNESLNVTGLAFGDASGDASKFAESAANNLGLAESAARQLQAVMGNIIVGFGASQPEAEKASEALIQRAADIGSAWNASTDEVTNAITSAFTSSTEPIRKFGVIIDEAAIKQEALKEGLIKAGGTLDNNSKRIAVTKLIMEQTNNVAGDFLNTQDGLANSGKQATAMWTDMKAQLGAGLLPVLTQVLGIFKGLGPEGMKLVVIGGAIVLGMSKIGEAAHGLSGAFTMLAANPWVAVAIGIVAVGVAIYKNWDTIKERGEALFGWFETIGGRIAAGWGALAEILSQPFTVAFNAIDKAWNATVGKIGFTLPSWVPGLGGKGFHMPQLPTYATGNVATGPTVGVFGEYPGARSNPEITSPVDLMRSTVLNALAESSAANGAAGQTIINLPNAVIREEQDIYKLARELDRLRSRESRAAGRPTVSTR